MKIAIGKHPTRWVSGVYSRHMNKKGGDVDFDKRDITDRFLEHLQNNLQWIYDHTINIYIAKREQKINIHIDPWDTWSMDKTLAQIIVPMLYQLRKDKQGSPHIDNRDVPKSLRKKTRKKGIDPCYHERWDWVIGEMIWAFSQKLRDDWMSDYIEIELDDTDVMGYKVIWEDPDGRAAHQERMTNGFRLFGKYYENLWD